MAQSKVVNLVLAGGVNRGISLQGAVQVSMHCMERSFLCVQFHHMAFCCSSLMQMPSEMLRSFSWISC